MEKNGICCRLNLYHTALNIALGSSVMQKIMFEAIRTKKRGKFVKYLRESSVQVNKISLDYLLNPETKDEIIHQRKNKGISEFIAGVPSEEEEVNVSDKEILSGGRVQFRRGLEVPCNCSSGPGTFKED